MNRHADVNLLSEISSIRLCRQAIKHALLNLGLIISDRLFGAVSVLFIPVCSLHVLFWHWLVVAFIVIFTSSL